MGYTHLLITSDVIPRGWCEDVDHARIVQDPASEGVERRNEHRSTEPQQRRIGILFAALLVVL